MQIPSPAKCRYFDIAVFSINVEGLVDIATGRGQLFPECNNRCSL